MRVVRTEIVCEKCGRKEIVNDECGPASEVLAGMGWRLTNAPDLCPSCYKNDKVHAMTDVGNSLCGIVDALQDAHRVIRASNYLEDRYRLGETECTDAVTVAMNSIIAATVTCARAHRIITEHVYALISDGSDDEDLAPIDPDLAVSEISKMYEEDSDDCSEEVPEDPDEQVEVEDFDEWEADE